MHAQTDAVNLSEAAVTAALGNVLASNQWCVTDLFAAALLDRLGARPTSVGVLVSDELDLTEIFLSLPVHLAPVPADEANVRLIPARTTWCRPRAALIMYRSRRPRASTPTCCVPASARPARPTISDAVISASDHARSAAILATTLSSAAILVAEGWRPPKG